MTFADTVAAWYGKSVHQAARFVSTSVPVLLVDLQHTGRVHNIDGDHFKGLSIMVNVTEREALRGGEPGPHDNCNVEVAYH